jgi:prolyl-tRNA synthetase
VEGLPAPASEPAEVETPGATTIEAVCELLGVPPGALVKAFPVVVDGRGPVLVVVRGDHRLNEIKLQNALGATFRPAEADEVRATFGAEPGFIGPVGAPVPVLADEALRGLAGLVAGGNKPDIHLTGVEPGRNFESEWVDVRRVEDGDLDPTGSPIHIEPAIEVGNIFKLGTRYSEPLGAMYLDESGAERPIVMGSYGVGPARIAAAAVEQFADDHGISWPASIAPFDVHLVGLGKEGTEEHALAERLYEELSSAGLQVLYDDRDLRPGEKFVEAELLGCPLRAVAGRRSLDSGELEVHVRRGMEQRAVPIEGATTALGTLLAELP